MGRSVAIIGTRGYPSYYGGFETLVRRLAPYLVEAGWDVTVYGRRGATKGDDPGLHKGVQRIDTFGIESKSASTLSYGLTSVLHATSRKPDVALVMNVANGYWLPALKIRGIPSVVNVDGIEWEREKWGKKAKLVFLGGAKLTARNATRLVCDSSEIQRRWTDDYGKKGDLIAYGGDVPGQLEVVDGLERRKYVLMVARFVPENTVAQFFEAAEKLAGHISVVIVGSSGYGGALDEAAKRISDRHQNVHWMGHISDDAKLFSLWQNAAVYFHGHSVGGTNPALVQAMACGAPTIARDTPYNREVLGDAGIFTAPDSDSIYHAIHDSLLDPHALNLLSKKAQERAQSEYSWQSICDKYATSLELAIQGQK